MSRGKWHLKPLEVRSNLKCSVLLPSTGKLPVNRKAASVWVIDSFCVAGSSLDTISHGSLFRRGEKKTWGYWKPWWQLLTFSLLVSYSLLLLPPDSGCSSLEATGPTRQNCLWGYFWLPPIPWPSRWNGWYSLSWGSSTGGSVWIEWPSLLF
jgi:hypothetical protein